MGHALAYAWASVQFTIAWAARAALAWAIVFAFSGAGDDVVPGVTPDVTFGQLADALKSGDFDYWDKEDLDEICTQLYGVMKEVHPGWPVMATLLFAGLIVAELCIGFWAHGCCGALLAALAAEPIYNVRHFHDPSTPLSARVVSELVASKVAQAICNGSQALLALYVFLGFCATPCSIDEDTASLMAKYPLAVVIAIGGSAMIGLGVAFVSLYSNGHTLLCVSCREHVLKSGRSFMYDAMMYLFVYDLPLGLFLGCSMGANILTYSLIAVIAGSAWIMLGIVLGTAALQLLLLQAFVAPGVWRHNLWKAAVSPFVTVPWSAADGSRRGAAKAAFALSFCISTLLAISFGAAVVSGAAYLENEYATWHWPGDRSIGGVLIGLGLAQPVLLAGVACLYCCRGDGNGDGSNIALTVL